MEESASQAHQAGSVSHLLETAQNSIRQDLEQQLEDRETRLTALVNVLGFEDLDALEQFVYLHGAVDVVPSTSRNRIESQTQLNVSPRKKEARNQRRKEELVNVRDELSLVKVELEYAKGVHKQTEEDLEKLQIDYRKALEEVKESRDLNVEYATRLARSLIRSPNTTVDQEYVSECEEEIRIGRASLEDLERKLFDLQMELTRKETMLGQVDLARQQAEFETKAAHLGKKEAEFESKMALRRGDMEHKYGLKFKREIQLLKSNVGPASHASPPSTLGYSPARAIISAPNLAQTVYRDSNSRSTPLATSAVPSRLVGTVAAAHSTPLVADRSNGTPASSLPSSTHHGLTQQYVDELRKYNGQKVWVVRFEKWAASIADEYISEHPSAFVDLAPRPILLPEELPGFPPAELVPEGTFEDRMKPLAGIVRFVDTTIAKMKAFRDRFWDLHKARKTLVNKAVIDGVELNGVELKNNSSSRRMELDGLTTSPSKVRPPSQHGVSITGESSYLYRLTSPSPKPVPLSNVADQAAVSKASPPRSTTSPVSHGLPLPPDSLAPSKSSQASWADSEPDTVDDLGEDDGQPPNQIQNATSHATLPPSSPLLHISPRKILPPRSATRSPKKRSTTEQYSRKTSMPRGPEPQELVSPRRLTSRSNSVNPSPAQIPTPRQITAGVRHSPLVRSEQRRSPTYRDSPPMDSEARDSSPPSRQPNSAQRQTSPVQVKEEPEQDDAVERELLDFDISPAQPVDEGKLARREKRRRERVEREEAEEEPVEEDANVNSERKDKPEKSDERADSEDEEAKRARRERRRRRREKESEEEAEEEEDEENEEPPKKKKKRQSKSRVSESDGGVEDEEVEEPRKKKVKNRNKEADISTRKIEINPARNKGQTTHFAGVERNKDARQQMHADTCDCCSEYYKRAHPETEPKDKKKNPYLEERYIKQQAHLQRVSRHRAHHRAEPDPPDYWQMGFPPTQKVEEINRRAAQQKAERRAYQEAEAMKPDGFYRFARTT